MQPFVDKTLGFTEENPLIVANIEEEYAFFETLALVDPDYEIIGYKREGSLEYKAGLLMDLWHVYIKHKRTEEKLYAALYLLPLESASPFVQPEQQALLNKLEVSKHFPLGFKEKESN